MTAGNALGIRNNNPLNIEYSTRNNWDGQTGPGEGGRFAAFSTPVYGIRAAAKLIRNYRHLYGAHTLSEIIHKWAPPSDNNSTERYISFVANQSGVSPGQQVTDDDLAVVLAGMIHFENGSNPYSGSLIRKGVRMAMS